MTVIDIDEIKRIQTAIKNFTLSHAIQIFAMSKLELKSLFRHTRFGSVEMRIPIIYPHISRISSGVVRPSATAAISNIKSYFGIFITSLYWRLYLVHYNLNHTIFDF